jgi:hypothetical protein
MVVRLSRNAGDELQRCAYRSTFSYSKIAESSIAIHSARRMRGHRVIEGSDQQRP